MNVHKIIEAIYLLKDSVPYIELNRDAFLAVKQHFQKDVNLQSLAFALNMYADDDVFFIYGVKVVRYIKPLDKAFEEIEKWRR